MAGPVTKIDAVISDATAEASFLRGGFARANFPESSSWRASYECLQAISRQFVRRAWRHGTDGYAWPLDPLNCWSRVWEYPFVAEQLRRFQCEGRGHRLLDLGAAVTFFPFYLIRRGIEVTNLDFDSRMPAHFERVFRLTSQELGVNVRPTYLTADARDTKLPGGSFDIITCISVLEHIPEWERALQEVSRLLKPNGLFILTFDVQHSGLADALSTEDCRRLLQLVTESMDALTLLEDSIPADALTPFNGTFRPPVTRVRSRLRQLWPITALPRKIVNRIRRKESSREPNRGQEDICIFGGAWRKRSTA